LTLQRRLAPDASRRPRIKRSCSFPREIRADLQLGRWSDCNEVSPLSRYRRLDCILRMHRPVPAVAGVKQAAPFQRGVAASIGKWAD
jgi:hypothetical protein